MKSSPNCYIGNAVVIVFVAVIMPCLLLVSSSRLNAQNLQNGLVGFYQFDGSAADSSALSPTNNGSISGTSFTCGPVDSAIVFNGTSDYVSLDTNFNLDSSYSISLWMKPSTFQLGAFFSMRNQCSNSPRGWDRSQMALIPKTAQRIYNDPSLVTVDNQLIFIHSRSNDNCLEWSSEYVYTIPGLSIDTSCYTHLVIVVEDNNSNENRNYTVYANEQRYEDTLASFPPNINLQNTTDPFSQPSDLYRSFFGTNHTNFNFPYNQFPFEGALDQVRFYNRKLNAEEAMTLYHEVSEYDLPSLSFDRSMACANQSVTILADALSDCDFFYWNLNGLVYGTSSSISFNKRPALDDTVQLVYRYRNICEEQTLTQIFKTPEIDTLSWTICPNDSVLFNGKIYKESGFFNDTIRTADCDSLVVIQISKIILNVELGNDSTLCIGESVLLDVTADSLSYLWQDGSTNSTYQATETNLYKVSVTNNCETKIDSAFYSFLDCNCILSMPNVFTPNSDQINDQMTPSSNCVTQAYSLAIYNRWGELLFESLSPEFAWDGTKSGKDVPEGTYFYTLSYTTLSGHKRKLTGSILLLR